MLSKEEWNAVAERAAAADYGTRHARWLRFRRFGAGPAGILLVAGAVGLGVWWVFAHLIRPAFDHQWVRSDASLPIAFWLFAAVALIATIYAFRPRIIPPAPSLRFLRAVVAGLIWLGLLTYAVTVLAA
jgi:hypothetical protein